MKRKWEDRTVLEEMLISIIQDIQKAIENEDEEALVELLEDKVDAMNYAFIAVPWEQEHSANDSRMENKSA